MSINDSTLCVAAKRLLGLPPGREITDAADIETLLYSWWRRKPNDRADLDTLPAQEKAAVVQWISNTPEYPAELQRQKDKIQRKREAIFNNLFGDFF